jgi:uncharacterized protein (TIGR03086 family)
MEATMSTDPIELFRRATEHATRVMDAVRPDQLAAPTPCTEWSVQDLVDHMVGSTEYLLASLAGRDPVPPTGTGAADYRTGVARVLDQLAAPSVLERTCTSPLGFEWTVGQAVAGTFMDNLVHTWDLATATGQDATLDAELVAACTALFFPTMPEMGRAGGLIGPAVEVPADAPPQVAFLAALGRHA